MQVPNSDKKQCHCYSGIFLDVFGSSLWHNLESFYGRNKVMLQNELNMCFLPRFLYWHLNPNVLGLGGVNFGRRLTHKGRAFMTRISALIKRDCKSADSITLDFSASVQWEINFYSLEVTKSMLLCYRKSNRMGPVVFALGFLSTLKKMSKIIFSFIKFYYSSNK